MKKIITIFFVILLSACSLTMNNSPKAKVKELADKYEVNVITDVDIKPFDNTVEFIEEKKTANFMTEASFMSNTKKIILGPGPVTAHEVDEHVTVESLRECVEQYKQIINEVCM